MCVVVTFNGHGYLRTDLFFYQSAFQIQGLMNFMTGYIEDDVTRSQSRFMPRTFQFNGCDPNRVVRTFTGLMQRQFFIPTVNAVPGL